MKPSAHNLPDNLKKNKLKLTYYTYITGILVAVAVLWVMLH
jgi:hypothetical protein